MKKFLLIIIASLSVSLNTWAQELKVFDTIAGYSTILETNLSNKTEQLIFKVKTASGATLKIPAIANQQGIASTEFDGYHTKKIGTYQVSLENEEKQPLATANFQVFSDIFSPSQSKISTDKASLNINTEEVIVRVIAKDKYQNPVIGQLIKLISSRREDNIEIVNAITDENGQAIFNIKSSTPGVSILTALNQTLGQEILKRKKIVFYKDETPLFTGGNLFSANMLTEDNIPSMEESFGILDHFDIEFPDEVIVNEENNLTVIAKDKDDNIVKSYTGTIRIAITGDDNAIIPNNGEYTFTEEVQGKKTFDVAMIFTTEGEKTIEIFDFDNGQINKTLQGNKTITVSKKTTTENNPIIKSEINIEIKSPANNSKLSSSTVTFSGLAEANTNLKLMLDDNKVAEISVDTEGFFSKTLEDIIDGEHEVFVIETENLRRASAPVKFTIDSTPPLIEKIILDPITDLEPETNYSITVYSESKLDFAKIKIAGIEETLEENPTKNGQYEATLLSPKNPGEYNINVVLADSMGNRADYRNQAVLKVKEKIIIKPDPPTNLLATAGEEKIDLTWQAPFSEHKIVSYNIYLGKNQYNLNITSQSKTLNAVLTNLENDQKYFMAVSAVDEKGEEGEKSDLIQAIPKKFEKKCLNNTYSATGKEPCIICPPPYQIENNNTECNLPEELHAAAEKKEEKPTTIPKKEMIRALPANAKVTLVWEPYEKAIFYKILFGIKSKKYEANLYTTNNESSYVIKDLLNNVPYYFTVVAVDENKTEISKRYPEISATPTGNTMLLIKPKKTFNNKYFLKDFSTEKTIKGNTGPQAILYLSLSCVFLVFIIFYFKKIKKLFFKNRPQKLQF